jgi:hypothetical protein
VKKSALFLLVIFTLFLAVSCNPRTGRPNPVMMYEFYGEGEVVVIENEHLHLRFLSETAEIILTDKATGVEWRSNPPNPASDQMADVVTRQLMESQLAIDYADNAGVGMTLQSSVFSVEKGAFEFGVVDGVLEVRYTIGDIARTHRIPPVITEERMLLFFDRMEWGDRQFIESGYRLFNINSLRLSDDRAQLLRDFPDLTEINLYVLRPGTPDFMREEFEEIFIAAGYTSEDFFIDSTRYELTGENVKPVFSITLRYILDGRSLLVNVPYDKIGFRSVYPLTRLTLLPFMGSGHADDRGYIMVPDGSGALIHFNNGRNNQIPYSINVFGWDDAMPRDAIITNNQAPFPAFGIYRNGATLLCVIEEGASYASVRADVSGRNSSWNRVFPVFDMVHGALMDISGRNQRAVYLYEATLPAGENITLRYTPCATPGYMGMAREYRAWLLNRYPELGNRRMADGVPIAVEIIGAVNKTQHRLGLPVDLPLRLTSYNEAAEMINDFAEMGWRNVHVKLNGWFNRSVEHTVPTRISLIRQLGSRNDFRNIVNSAERHNFTLYPEVDFMFMRDVGLFSGFNLYRDAARYVNRERAQTFPYSFVWFGERTQWGKLNYLSRPAATFRMIDNFMDRAENHGLRNIAFRNMGSRLAGDFHERRHVSREASMRMRQQQFSKMAQAGTEIMVNAGFSFSVPWASIITDMNISDNSFGITDTSIPFYQIVLSGLVPYTGRAINLAEDYKMNLLKTIESGAGLYFSFKIEDTAILQETKYRQFYANEYAKWIGDANAIYHQFVSDFGHVFGQAIVNHIILSRNVTITEFEDGTGIIVNASRNPWNYNGNIVDPESYIVVRRNPVR